jgi:entericidin B
MEPFWPKSVPDAIFSQRGNSSMKLSQFATIAVLAGALAVSACANTIKGVGKDAANTVNATESAGKSVANAVD